MLPAKPIGPAKPLPAGASRQTARAMTWDQFEELVGSKRPDLPVSASKEPRSRKNPIVFSSYLPI